VPEVYVLDPIRETVVRVEGGDNGLLEHSAIGQPSAGLALTFATIDGHLAVCCPAGRIVRPGDDPFGWLAEEQHRADQAEANTDRAQARAETAEARADTAEARAESAEAEVASLRAELDRLKPPSSGS
jgi:hypothetical protein